MPVKTLTEVVYLLSRQRLEHFLRIAFSLFFSNN